jgi:hypothetical protein
MTRLELLQQGAQENKSEVVFKKVVNTELRKFNKEISDLEYEIEGKMEKIQERLSNVGEVTMAEVKIMFAEIKKLIEEQELIQDFIEQFYTEEEDKTVNF